MLSKPDSCTGCALHTLSTGWMIPSGTGKNGVLLVGEALGEKEAEVGLPFQGKAGEALNKLLFRGGMQRDDFLVANTLFCRPPDNKLTGEAYEKDAIQYCAPNLDGVIQQFKPKCIVTLGVTAFKRVLPEVASLPGVGLLDSKKHKGARGYVFWSALYQTWVLPTIHPSYIARGKTSWAQVLIHDCQRGTEIARDGYAYSTDDFSLDPPPDEALEWVKDFEAYALEHPDVYLSCDIETPEKGADEEDLDLEDGTDYVILRCGYSYKDHHGLSIPWGGTYSYIHERLLGHPSQKLWWNGSYDIPRILAQGVVIGGASHDGMDAWHCLNSDLKKSLGFVTPFFIYSQRMWKHLANAQPALYNCIDAMTAGMNMRGTVALLRRHGMWDVYNEYVNELDPVFSTMTRAGMPVDQTRRIDSSQKLIKRRNEVRTNLETIVPLEVKNLQPKRGYIRPPSDVSLCTEVVFDAVRKVRCPKCGLEDPAKKHFQVYKRKPNPCAGLEATVTVEGTKRWAKVLPFTPSPAGVMKYQKYRGHPLIMVGRGSDRKATTDIKAINKLIGKHPTDPFYPLVVSDREYTKLGGTYIGWFNPLTGKVEGGFPLGKDGSVHCHFRNTPSTLRTSTVSPNLQNLPRGNDSEVQRWVKQMFVAREGWIFRARDFSGIEAQLVGVHANDREFLRLAKIDIHSYFTAFNLNRLGVLPAADLPDLKWSDSDLRGHLKGIKHRFKSERDIGKRCIHAGDYRAGPTKLHEEYPSWFPRVKDAAMVLGLFYEVFPAIPKWHERICLLVDREVITRNSFGHVHRFYQVLNWTKRGSDWVWDYGDDAKRLIAFGPQSDAAFIGRAVLKRLYYNYPDSMALWLRLFIHDEVLCMVPKPHDDLCDDLLAREMQACIPQIPLDPAWGFGEFLSIETEPKVGECWGEMQ